MSVLQMLALSRLVADPSGGAEVGIATSAQRVVAFSEEARLGYG